MKAYLDGCMKMVQEGHRKPQWAATEWYAWFPVSQPLNVNRMIRVYGAQRAEKHDKTVNGTFCHCFYFGKHEEGALSRAWAFFQEMNS